MQVICNASHRTLIKVTSVSKPKVQTGAFRHKIVLRSRVCHALRAFQAFDVHSSFTFHISHFTLFNATLWVAPSGSKVQP